MHPLQPGDTVGPWVVHGLLGQGGVAHVYDVTDDTGQPAALKRLHHASADAVARLRREAEALQGLVHPNIVRLIEWIEPDSLVLERVDGPGLAEVASGLDLPELEALFHQVLDGVACAHAAGWIHRDLKPSNILLSREGDRIVAKVADFGLAHLTGRHTRLTTSGMFMGTPAYMAPEQARDPLRADVRADVFSLGAILYELVCGRAPFPGSDVFAVLAQADRGDYPDPQALRPDLPDRIAHAIRGALAPDPAHRIPSGDALRDTLTGAIAWSPPDLSQTRPQRTVAARRRRWRPWTWALAVPVVLLGAWLTLGAVTRAPPAQAPQASEDSDRQARFAVAWDRWIHGRFDGVDVQLAPLLDDAPEPWVHALHGLAAGHQGDDDRAAQAFDRARALLSSEPSPLRDLLAAMDDDYDGWNDTVWTELAATHPDDPLIQGVSCSQLGWGTESERACDRMDSLGPIPVVWLSQARLAIRRGVLDDARTYTRSFLDAAPGHPLGVALVAERHAAAGDWSAARREAERALDSVPHLAEAHRVLAACDAHQGDLAAARRRYGSLHDPVRPLAERVRSAIAQLETEFGLGHVTAGVDRLAPLLEETVREGKWRMAAELWVRDGRLAWALRDAARLHRAHTGLAALTDTPGSPSRLHPSWRAAQAYMAGLEAVLGSDNAALERALERLAAEDTPTAAWYPHETATLALYAYAHDARGEPTPLLQLARDGETCEAVAFGGQLLVERGHVDAGVARLQTADEWCAVSGLGRFYRFVAADTLARTLAASGAVDAARSARAQAAELWPEPEPGHPLIR